MCPGSGGTPSTKHIRSKARSAARAANPRLASMGSIPEFRCHRGAVKQVRSTTRVWSAFAGPYALSSSARTPSTARPRHGAQHREIGRSRRSGQDTRPC